MVIRYRIAPSVELEMKSKLEGGTVFICSQATTVNGIIDTTGDV